MPEHINQSILLTISFTTSIMKKNKSDLIIDKDYKPNINGTLMDYFNRSMVFSQTNYKDQLETITRANFAKLTPTKFLEEYTWCLYCSGMKVDTVLSFFPNIVVELRKLYPNLRDPNIPLQLEDFRKNILLACKNERKVEALISTVTTLQNGIRLFGWDMYKHNFIGTPEKIMNSLPFMGKVNAKHLSRNIGLTRDVCGGIHMNRLCSRWGFSSPTELCKEIQKHVFISLPAIELTLWLAASHFGTNVPVR